MPGAVAHVERHLVRNGDAIAEHVLVTHIARIGLARQIELAEGFALGQVQAKRVVLGLWHAGVARIARELFIAALHGVVLAVEHQIAIGKYLLGNGVQPPVHQVKMVRAFVDQQGARILNLRMPAPEVIRAMVGVQQVLQIDGMDFADHATGNQLLDLSAEWCPAVVEGDPHALAGGFHGFHDCAALGGIGGHGLLGDDIAACVQGAHDVLVVCRVFGADKYLIGLLLAQHVVKTVCGVGRHGVVSHVAHQQFVVVRHAGGAEVANAHQLVVLAVGGDQGLDEAQSPPAGAYECVTFFAHGSLPPSSAQRRARSQLHSLIEIISHFTIWLIAL